MGCRDRRDGPRADTLNGSRHANMKELRFGAATFAFDTRRKAILPIAGDKSGKEMTMPTNVDDIIEKLSPAQRKKVKARAARLIAEKMTLRELRHARKLTQVRIAKALGVTQDSVSRLEKRGDLLLSTLRKTVEAMGGKLSLVAEFPDRAPVVLSGIGERGPERKLSARRK
jgi:DNA-binding XRE family transcriptional regulator